LAQIEIVLELARHKLRDIELLLATHAHARPHIHSVRTISASLASIKLIEYLVEMKVIEGRLKEFEVMNELHNSDTTTSIDRFKGKYR